MSRQDRKLDLAARAAWLYYVASNTQDEIAQKLNVSRQAAQRLVSLAVSEKLIKFRLEHQIAECMTLGEQLRTRFDLGYCSVQPSDSATEHPSVGIAKTSRTRDTRKQATSDREKEGYMRASPRRNTSSISRSLMRNVGSSL